MVKYIRHIPKPLLDDIVQGRCIPIIGAGFSRNAELPSGLQMPLWNDIGKFFAEQMSNYPFSTPIDAISAFCHEFSRAKLVEELSDILHINNAKPGPTHISFAKLPFDIVVTTNFDFLLERACEITNRHYRPVIDEDQLSITTIEHGTTLLKIHGDLNHPSRLIVTEEDYDTFLEKYPLISTYIANLLISRTPLFIGYSLEDPDFRQIWQVIGSRLGKLRRTAYTVSVGAHSVDIARFERRGVKVISLSGSTASYGKILETLFQELGDYWLDKLIEVSTVVDEEPLIELALPRDAQTRLCYFAIPAKLHAFYQNYIFPIVERFGFTPVTAMDVLSPGDNILAKVSTLIDRATLIVADVSTSWVLSEVGMAASKERKVLTIIEEGRVFPSEISEFPYIKRLSVFEPPDSKFIDEFEKYFENISKDLEVKLYEEPRRLLDKKEYRAAVISAITLLEAQTRELLMPRVFKKQIPVGETEMWRTPTLGEVLKFAVKNEFIVHQELTQLKEWITIRNRLVHTNEKISPQKARKIVNGVMQILQDIRNRRQ